MLDHAWIGTEHILLGLLREGDGHAARTLESLGISLDAARQQDRLLHGAGERRRSSSVGTASESWREAR
jgi:ATP-dependent Clp protease ATP-binding subunit ClpC